MSISKLNFKKLNVNIATQPTLPSSTQLRSFDTATIDKRAMSVEVRSLVTLDDYLRHRVRAIAGDNGAVLSVYHTAADYRFTTNVAKEVWSRYIDTEIKTQVASLMLSKLDDIVRAHAPNATRQVQDVISVLIATMLEKQGMMSIELPQTSIQIPCNVFPSFKMMKHEALVKATYDRIKAIDVEKAFYSNTVGSLALKPFAEVFAKYSHIFHEIVLLGDKIDAFAAGTILKLYDRDAHMGALRGSLNNPALERAKSNYTLVSSALDYFFRGEGTYPSVDSLMGVVSAVGVTQVSDAFQEASLLLNEPEYFQEVAIKSLPSLVNIYRFINNNGLPIGYIAQPNYKGQNEGLNVSEYFESDTALNNLEESSASENHLQPLVVSMYDNLRNISESIAPLVGRIMLNDNGIAEDGMTYQPVALHIGLTDTALEHLAVAMSNSVSYSFEAGEVVKAYVFEKKQKDYQQILGLLSSEMAYTAEPEAVMLFAGQQGVQRATSFWELGSQTLPAKVRPARFVGGKLFDDGSSTELMDVLVNKEQKLTRTWKVSVSVPTGAGGAIVHSITTSLYELYASSERAEYLRDERYVTAHTMPLLCKQVQDVVGVYLALSKLPKQQGYVQSPAETARVQFANLVVPIVSNGTFRRFLQSLKYKLLAKASSDSLEKRIALENFMLTSDIEAKLSAELLRTIFVRLGLLSFDEGTEMFKSLLSTTEFYTVIRPHIVNVD